MTADELRSVLAIASEHLRQYAGYADDMRMIGRGMIPHSAYNPDVLRSMIDAALAAPTSKPSARKVAAPALVKPLTPLEDLTDGQRFAHFKKTAPLEDAKRPIRNGGWMPEDLRAEWLEHIAAIEAGTAGNPTAIHKQNRRLYERLNIARTERDRANGWPEVGTPAWGTVQDFHATWGRLFPPLESEAIEQAS